MVFFCVIIYKNGKPKRGGSPRKKFEYLGECFTLNELAELSGHKLSTLINRIYAKGWTVEKAVETPLYGNRKED